MALLMTLCLISVYHHCSDYIVESHTLKLISNYTISTYSNYELNLTYRLLCILVLIFLARKLSNIMILHPVTLNTTPHPHTPTHPHTHHHPTSRHVVVHDYGHERMKEEPPTLTISVNITSHYITLYYI